MIERVPGARPHPDDCAQHLPRGRARRVLLGVFALALATCAYAAGRGGAVAAQRGCASWPTWAPPRCRSTPCVIAVVLGSTSLYRELELQDDLPDPVAARAPLGVPASASTWARCSPSWRLRRPSTRRRCWRSSRSRRGSRRGRWARRLRRAAAILAALLVRARHARVYVARARGRWRWSVAMWLWRRPRPTSGSCVVAACRAGGGGGGHRRGGGDAVRVVLVAGADGDLHRHASSSSAGRATRSPTCRARSSAPGVAAAGRGAGARGAQPPRLRAGAGAPARTGARAAVVRRTWRRPIAARLLYAAALLVVSAVVFRKRDFA